eukprot:5277362-Prymnesium_polylepis.1
MGVRKLVPHPPRCIRDGLKGRPVPRLAEPRSACRTIACVTAGGRAQSTNVSDWPRSARLPSTRLCAHSA